MGKITLFFTQIISFIRFLDSENRIFCEKLKFYIFAHHQSLCALKKRNCAKILNFDTAPSNFAPLDARNDTGALWENFIISERIKRNHYSGNYAQLYFWCTHDQSEIGLIEEIDGQLHTYEFKWNKAKKAKFPTSFQANYPNSTFEVITPDNYWSFI